MFMVLATESLQRVPRISTLLTFRKAGDGAYDH